MRLETGPGSARFQHHFSGPAAPRQRLRACTHVPPERSVRAETQACWGKQAVLTFAGHQSPAGASKGRSTAWLGRHVPACRGRAGGHGAGQVATDKPAGSGCGGTFLSTFHRSGLGCPHPRATGECRGRVCGPGAPESGGPVRGRSPEDFISPGSRQNTYLATGCGRGTLALQAPSWGGLSSHPGKLHLSHQIQHCRRARPASQGQETRLGVPALPSAPRVT